MVELIETIYGWSAECNGVWEFDGTAWLAYRRLSLHSGVNIEGLAVMVSPRDAQPEVVSAQDAWALNERF